MIPMSLFQSTVVTKLCDYIRHCLSNLEKGFHFTYSLSVPPRTGISQKESKEREKTTNIEKKLKKTERSKERKMGVCGTFLM
jgi:hypothetical protein